MAECFDVGTEAREDKIFSVAGVLFPNSSLITPQSVDRALTLRPLPTDVILSSYPKCDSKCIDTIIWKLLYMDLKEPSVNNLINRFLPCIEMEIMDHLSNAYDYILRHKLPRLFKTYLPYKLIPFNKRAKYIYVIRTPWEVCTSYYKFLLMLNAVTDPFDVFLSDFLNGNVAYGSYFQHIMPWNKKINESNVLILCHEHVEHNPRSAIFTIAAFLGESYLIQLMNNIELEKSILRATNWDKLKGVGTNMSTKCSSIELDLLQDYTDINYHSDDDDDERANSKITYTETQMKEITEKMSSHFRDSSIEFLWLSLLKKQSSIVFT